MAHIKTDLIDDVAGIILGSDSIILVPGYGMAVSQAQFELLRLTDALVSMGKKIRFALHPLAGRMPGHMTVVLAEAGVEYDLLKDMDEINPDFKETDLVLVIGACDVVNPSAMDHPGTPISGMPILLAHEARKVIVCNYDSNPGYSGVENPLYENPKTLMVSGDARRTALKLTAAVKAAG